MSERVNKANREALVNILLRHTRGLTEDEIAALAESIESAGFRRRTVMLDVECSKCGARDQRRAMSRAYTGPTGACKECGERTFPLGVMERKAVRKAQAEETEKFLDRIFGERKKASDQ